MHNLIKPRYSALPAEYDEPDTPIKSQHFPISHARNSWLFQTALYIAVALIGIALGVIGGQFSVKGFFSSYPLKRFQPSFASFRAQVDKPPGRAHEIWHPNDTFTGTPSADPEHAWEALIPLGKGFIQHPQLAPVNKAVAAYHQIHCLHGIQLAYYMRLNDLHKQQNPLLRNRYLESIGPHAQSHAHHVEHCFDYLRQSLMCFADSNLEDVDETGEATGWGNERICRDYKGLFRWSERWRWSENEGIL